MKKTLFDEPYYLRINDARWAAAERILDQLPGIETCLDIGCGPGWFAERLSRRGYKVLGVDGRKELVEEARRRAPQCLFSQMDICERRDVAVLPEVDLVFCFGLLYHLENPAAALRGIVTRGRRLLIETQIAPRSGAFFQVVAEGRNETQGLDYVALIPTRDALVHLLYQAGAKSVERYTGSVDHEDFVDTPEQVHRREMFMAGPEPSGLKDFVSEPLPAAPKLDTRKKA